MYYFVGGYARTGTTLIYSILCGDPKSNPPLSEISYVEYLMFPYEAMVKGWDSNYWLLFDDLTEFRDFHRGVLDMFFQHLMKKHNCEKLIMKRPFLTIWFPVLALMFPDAQFIICVRDPRDVIGSLKRVKRKHDKSDLVQQDKNPFLDQSLTDMAHGYTRGVKACLDMAKEFKSRFHFVKYEELVEHPERSMKIIGHALRLDPGLGKHWEEQNWRHENPFYSKGWGQPITNKNIGLHKTQLDSEEIEMVELVCRFIMEAFNYG